MPCPVPPAAGPAPPRALPPGPPSPSVHARTPSHVVRRLLKKHEGLGADTVELHRVGPGLGLEDLLEGSHVGYIHDQPHTVGLRGIGEELTRDAHGSEDPLPFARAKRMVPLAEFVHVDIPCQVTTAGPGYR